MITPIFASFLVILFMLSFALLITLFFYFFFWLSTVSLKYLWSIILLIFLK